VKFHSSNHHLYKHARMGEFLADGQVKQLYESPLIEPNPFPKI
jgi:urea transport system substrate-binding protein